MNRDELNLATVETAPFSAGDGHRDLHGLVGEWEGTTRTWLDPSAPPDEGRTAARIEIILGGRFIRFEYRGTVIGKSHAGEMLIGCDSDGRIAAAWIDSFHMATGIMMSTGDRRSDGAISVLGSYDAGGQKWGWRTALRLDQGQLAIETTNISPEGEEYRATESRLVRR